MIEELKKRPEDELSVLEGLLEARAILGARPFARLTEKALQVIQAKHTITCPSRSVPMNSLVVRERLGARTIATHIPDMVEELQLEVQDHIPAAGRGKLSSICRSPVLIGFAAQDGWVDVQALPMMRRIVARLSTRVFVGIPTCA